MEERLQRHRDAERQLAIFESTVVRQEALTQFVLGCMNMAYDLQQICECRRLNPYPAEEFRKSFGRELFEPR